MSVIIVPAECTCDRLDLDLQKCPEHHRIFRKGKRLASVGSVVRLWPQKPCNACKATSYDTHSVFCPVFAKIENAQERGREVDMLLTSWIRGELRSIPTGSVRQDSADLFIKVKDWMVKQPFDRVEAQVLLGDDEIGGIVDLVIDGDAYDLKATYEVGDAHRLQIAGYAQLLGPQAVGTIIHVTERYDTPRCVSLEQDDYEDWDATRQFWEAVKRRGL